MLCTHHEPATPARTPPHASTKPRRPRQLRPTIGGHHVQLTHSANRPCACRPVPARLCETALGRPSGTLPHPGSSTQGRTGCRVRDHGRAQGHAVRGCGPRGCVAQGPRNSHLQGRPPVVRQHRKRPLWTSLPALGRPRSTPAVRAQQPAARCKAWAEEPAVGHASSATAARHQNTPFRGGAQLSPHAAEGAAVPAVVPHAKVPRAQVLAHLPPSFLRTPAMVRGRLRAVWGHSMTAAHAGFLNDEGA